MTASADETDVSYRKHRHPREMAFLETPSSSWDGIPSHGDLLPHKRAKTIVSDAPFIFGVFNFFYDGSMIYRACVIGCGVMGSLPNDVSGPHGIRSHAGAYRENPKTHLESVCDTDINKAKAVAQQWQVKNFFSDPKQLILETAPEIVSICTPNGTHAEILEMVLKAPQTRAVLIEKPITLSAQSAQHLVRLAQDRKIALSVNYSRRFSKGFCQIKQRLAENEFGQIQSVSGFYTKGIFHNGTHWLDLCRWLIGEIDEVAGFFRRPHPDSDDQIDAWLRFKKGSTGFLKGLSGSCFSLFEMDIVGSQGRMKISESGHKVQVFETAESTLYKGYSSLRECETYDNEMRNLVYEAVVDLVTAIETGRAPACSGEDGLKAVEIAEMLLLSESEGKRRRI